MYDDILQAVIDMAQNAAGAPVLLGSMPPDDGIAMTGQASEDSIFLDIGSTDRLVVVCNGKSADQRKVIRQLDAIHQTLTRRKVFPTTDAWQIYAIETISGPRLIGREANRQWLYGSSLAVKVNIKGVC